MTDPSPDIDPPLEEAPLQGVLAHVLGEMDGEDSNLRDIVASMGHRAFGPVMVLCGLFLMTPLGALPGIPAAFGLINIAFAVQLLLRRPHPWVPDILAKVRVPHARVAQVHGKVSPWLARIDNVIRPRLPFATEGPMLVLAALVAILLSAAMIPLGIIPFGVVPAAFMLGLMGLALIARDGVLMMIALGLSLGIFVWVGTLVAGLAS
ncbi:MAG: exopolysaccharide biosynthesis protein [Litorimonas sp.]